MDIDKKKLEEFIKHLDDYDSLEYCKQGHHSDSCVSMSDTEIWWKCRTCGRVTSTKSGPFTI